MFVHLHCHSHYSFLRAVPSPAEIVAAAAAAKMPAVALTDAGGLYAAIPFYQAAREAGVQPLIGAVIEAAVHAPRPARAERGPAAQPRPLLLLASSRAGYSHLCELVTRAHLDGAPVTAELLHAHRQGLIALHAPEKRAHAADEEEDRAALLKEIFGAALYLETWRFPSSGRTNLREALRLGRALDAPLAAANAVHFLRPADYPHHRVLNAIRTGALVTRMAPPEIADAEAFFKTAEEMRRAFADHPEALRATLEIAEKAQLELELGRTIFPEFPVPAGETSFSWLWKLSFRGARQRYQPPRPEVLARLTHELEIIHRLRLAPYFLLVHDIVEEARRRGIPAVARGSAASSMVTYCLGISRACPLRWGLYFERFLNEERGDVPDIDLDICGARRDELLEYVYTRWGEGHVAMIGSFITMHARLAVREVAKAFGVAPGEVNHFTRRLPHRPVREIAEAIRTLPECRSLPVNEEPWKTILPVALRLDDFPRHLGIHPCGTVIAARPLAEMAPLERATKGIVVTQFDMNAIEALGLIKMDLLGQRGLTTMSLALANIEEAGGRVDFDAIPEDDPGTQALTAAGRTMGIFQIESPGMRGLLRTQKAHTLEDICLALALIRPGASEYGTKESFLRRLRGAEPVRYPHPALEPILRDSLGLCVYQEQVMQLAQAAGGLTLAEAGLVRRARAKFSDERERARLRAKFLKCAERAGLDGRAREETWGMVEKFAGFGFCKAHAATYAEISWRIAYLKAHHPAEFLAAMCSSEAGFYHVSAYVQEARRWGIAVRLPCVNRSEILYTTEAAGPGHSAEAPRALRIGLMQVRSLRQEAARAIVESRARHGRFRSLEDFLRRVPLARHEIEALIKCGAMDGLAARQRPRMTRPALLWQLSLLLADGGARLALSGDSSTPMLFPAAAPPQPPAIPLPRTDYSLEQRLRYEQEILELAVSGHPLDGIARHGEVWSTDLDALRGRRVRLLGWLITFRHVSTKDYRNMMFATLEDQRGLYEAVLFPETYARCGGLVFETRALRVTGRVEPTGQLNCEKLEPAKS